MTGQVYAADYAPPTPATMTAAILDMQNAYTDGMSRAPGATELGAGSIGGLTLAPGVYKWSSNVTIPSNLTLSGGANDVWLFQIAQNLTVSSGVNIVLTGGAQASNVFWVVAGQTTIGTTAVFNGTILDQTSIVLNTGARLERARIRAICGHAAVKRGRRSRGGEYADADSCRAGPGRRPERDSGALHLKQSGVGTNPSPDSHADHAASAGVTTNSSPPARANRSR